MRTIIGSDGLTTIVGTSGADLITDWAKVFLGGGGNDDIHGRRAGVDTLYGGRGSDTLYGDADASGGRSDTIYGGNGHDTIDGDGGDDLIAAGYGNDLVIAGSGDDTAFGGPGADVVHGNGGDDLLAAGDGYTRGTWPDEIYIGDELRGGSGNDSLRGSDFDDVIYGGSGNDRINAGLSNVDGGELVYGGGGDDSILANGDTDTLYGGPGNDTIDGTAAWINEQIFGGIGDDVIRGQLVSGGDGNDVLVGYSDRYGGGYLQGEAGDDVIYIEEGNGANGGNGDDIIYGGTASGSHVIASPGDDWFFAGDGFDLISLRDVNFDGEAILGFDGDSITLYDIDADTSTRALDRFTWIGETDDPGAGEVGFYRDGDDAILIGDDGAITFRVVLVGLGRDIEEGDVSLGF